MRVILKYILKREYTNKVLEKLMKLMCHKKCRKNMWKRENNLIKNPILIGKMICDTLMLEIILCYKGEIKKKTFNEKEWNKNKIRCCQLKYIIKIYYLTFCFQWKAIGSLYKILSNKINKSHTFKSMVFPRDTGKLEAKIPYTSVI